MPKADTKLANQDLFLKKIHGVAQGCKQHSQTTYGEEYSVLYKGSILTKEVTERVDFFLRTENGKELPLSFPVVAPIRDGHLVTALYACAGDPGRPMVSIGFYNESTEMLHLAPVVAVYKGLGIGYPASQFFAKMGCSTIILTIVLMIFLAVTVGDGWFWNFLFLLLIGSVVFTGYGAKKLDGGKNNNKYLAEYAQLQAEVTRLFA